MADDDTVATALLSEFLRRHNDGVAARDFAPLAALFADAGEIEFRGRNLPGATGRTAIERLFRDGGASDALVPWAIVSDVADAARTVYGRASQPGLAEGTLSVRAAASAAARGTPLIARLTICLRAGGPTVPVPRLAARVLVMAPGPQVLLLRVTEPLSRAHWWIMPGGGIDPGEDARGAARRELVEEIGLEAPGVGPHIWTREHVWHWGANIVRQHETIFLHEVPARFDAAPALEPALIAKEGITDFRWWTPAEIAAATHDAFAPRHLARFLGDLVRNGAPSTPIDVGI